MSAPWNPDLNSRPQSVLDLDRHFIRLQSLARRHRYLKSRSIDSLAAAEARSAAFARVREEVRGAGTDSLDHFGNGYMLEGGLSLQQNPDEFAALCVYLGETAPHRTYVEIGSASGGACLFLSERVGFERVLSIDDGRHPRASEQARNLGRIRNCSRLLADSHAQLAQTFLESHVTDLDIAFIDGDHRFPGVMQDVRLLLPFCHNGTLIVFHDTVASGDVERAWLECIRRQLIEPVAEYVGAVRPLGIGIGRVGGR
jgi:predicted O-methyltransferase YrrM